MVVVVRKLPANAGDIRDSGSIPGSGRSPEGGHVNHSSVLACRTWPEKHSRLQSTGPHRRD